MALYAQLSGKELRQFHLDFSSLEMAELARLNIKTEKDNYHQVTIIPEKTSEDHVKWSFKNGMMHHWGWDKKFKVAS